MVDWDRVEDLRGKGWDWERIADDPKVGFHPDTSVRDPGRALRALYHRHRSRAQRQTRPAAPSPKKGAESHERRWTLTRLGYLLTPILGIWFLAAYLVPSPVGLVVPAIPYLALGLTVVAFALLFGLWRSNAPRWSKTFRTTLIAGVVLGLLATGLITVTGFVVGCPFLPSASSATTQSGPGWTSVSVSPWHDGGKVVVYFYGATWCPYCSASSWAVWKALTEFGTVSGAVTSYSFGSPEPYQYTPEMVLANVAVSSSHVSFQVSEYVAGSDSVFPSTSNCVQQAYVSAYSGGSIPFLVINGQYVHAQTSLVPPQSLSTWAGGASGGAATVQSQVSTESGPAWTAVQTQAWWTMAFMAKSTGVPVSQLASTYHWSSATQSAVAADVAAIR